jgi:hypothetical protein
MIEPFVDIHPPAAQRSGGAARLPLKWPHNYGQGDWRRARLDITSHDARED